jgi:antitoxin CcdA
MKLGLRLRQLGVTQKRFAAELGVSEATVSGWVSGRTIPDLRKIPLIESATGGAVTLADFLDSLPAATPRPALPATGPAACPQSVAPGGLAEPQLPLAAEAARLGLDAAAIAGQALRQAIGAEKARRWAEENRAAIEAHARYVEAHGVPLAKYRMF